MTIDQVTIAGFAGKNACTSSTQNGKTMTKLSVATTKRYKDADGTWQEKTQWHTCVAYAGTADYCSKIQTGDKVSIEGELIYSEYDRTIETDNGPVKVQWPVTKIVIESLSVISRKAREERKGRLMRPGSAYSLDCSCGHHIESESTELVFPDCQRPVRI